MVDQSQSSDGQKSLKVGLTDAKIKGLIKPLHGQVEYADQTVPGLRLRVGASGQKTFILRKRVGGQPRNITIGRFGPRCSLLDARRKAPVQARNVCAQLSAFYTWALPRLDRLASNPCRDAGRPPAPKARDRVLSDAELAALWEALGDEQEPWTSAIRLLILTGQRRNEVYSAEWTEIDIEQRIWTIPAVRAKNGKTHIVPLSDFAVKIIRGLERTKGTPKLFPAKSSPHNGPSGFSKVQARLRSALGKRLGDVDEWRLHDLRRTVATGLQRIGVRLEVTEAVLNHVSGSQSGIVGVYQRYNFSTEKRLALDAWADEVQRILKKEHG